MVDGRREAPRDVDNGPVKHSEGLEVVVDAHDRHDDGFHHGCFGGAPRRDAGGGAHGGAGFGSSVVLKLEGTTQRFWKPNS